MLHFSIIFLCLLIYFKPSLTHPSISLTHQTTEPTQSPLVPFQETLITPTGGGQRRKQVQVSERLRVQQENREGEVIQDLILEGQNQRPSICCSSRLAAVTFSHYDTRAPEMVLRSECPYQIDQKHGRINKYNNGSRSEAEDLLFFLINFSMYKNAFAT